MDNADFLDSSLKYGGEMTNYVLGVNWYLEKNLKAQFNYIYADADHDRAYTDNNGVEQKEQDTSILQARLQFVF